MAFSLWYAQNKAGFAGLGGGKESMKKASETWSKLSEEVKTVWKEKAAEKKLEPAPVQSEEVDEMPKKSPNAFQLFLKDPASEIPVELKGRERLKKAGEMWKNMPADQKQVFQDKAKKGQEEWQQKVQELEKKDAQQKTQDFVFEGSFHSKVRFQASDAEAVPEEQAVTVHEQKGADVVAAWSI